MLEALRKPPKGYSHCIIICLTIAIALYLRILNLSWGVPEMHPFSGRYMSNLYPDEPNMIEQMRGISQNIFDIKSFAYPPLQAQIGALLKWIFPISQTPGLYLLARSLSVMASILTIVALYCLGRAWSPGVASIAAAFLAVSMLSVREAHWANPESLNAFWIMLAILILFRAERLGTSAIFLLIGISIGLSICSKYFGGLFLHLPILLLIKHFLEKKSSINRWSVAYVAVSYAAVIIVVCLLLAPYIIMNKQLYLAWLEWGGGWMKSENGLYGTYPKPISVPSYILHMLPVSLGYPLYFLSIVGIVLSVWTRHRDNLFLLACILPFWIALETIHYRPLRFSLTLLPALCLFAAYFCDYLLKHRTKFISAFGIALLAFTLIYSFMYSYAFINVLSVKRDIRFSIDGWISEHIKDSGQPAMLAHNTTHNSMGLVQYIAIDQFNGPDYEISKRLPPVIIVPKIFLDVLKQCLDLNEKGYICSEKDWWPLSPPVPETLAFVQDLLDQKNYKVIKVFKNQAAFDGITFKDDRLRFDYLWFTNLEVSIYQRYNTSLSSVQ
jgi:hypothetical protein